MTLIRNLIQDYKEMSRWEVFKFIILFPLLILAIVVFGIIELIGLCEGWWYKRTHKEEDFKFPIQPK